MGTNPGILDLLGDPGGPLYAEPLSTTEHFDALLVGARHIGELPKCGCCRDSEATACMYEDKARQACQKILGCLDMRVLDGNLIIPTCLHTPTLILPSRRFIQMYYNPDIQGRYASQFPSGGQGFLQPRGDIRASIVPRDFRALPVDVHEAINAYFHREQLEDWAEKDPSEDQDMSTDTEAAGTVRQLQVGDPAALASLQEAERDMLMLAMAPWPQEQEYYYNSNDSVLDLDVQFPKIAEQRVEWQVARSATASTPAWRSPNFRVTERACYNREPNLREVLNQARQARAVANIPIHPVAPLLLLSPEVPKFTTIRDLDCQCQQCFDQTVAKWQSSPPDSEQRKWAKTPPQSNHENALIREHAWSDGHRDCECGQSRTRSKDDRQWELDWARSKSRKHSKSRICSKSRKCSNSRRHSKSRAHCKSRACSTHEARKSGMWMSHWERSQSKGHLEEEDKSCGLPSRVRDSPLLPSHSYEQLRSGWHTEHPAPSNREQSKHDKLKEEVVKRPHEYIWERTILIAVPWHPTTQQSNAYWHFAKMAWNMLATIIWGMQHWKLQGPFPVLPVPKWLCTPQMTQTMMPLTPVGTHLRDTRVLSPAMWAWMAVLLQFWQDHITQDLFGGCLHQTSYLANTLICYINPWLPHNARFGWDYVATQATLWLDICKQFTKEHFREWEAQKSCQCQLGALKHNTEIVYHWCLTKRQVEVEAAESREAAAKQLLPEWQVAHAERQVWATPAKTDVVPVQLESSLYPNWVWKQDTRPKGSDLPRPYRTPKEDDREELTLEEELDVKSVFDPLASGSKSSQLLNSQFSVVPDKTTEVVGLKTPPHFCKAPISVPPFDLALIGMPAKMSPMMEGENALLNLMPGPHYEEYGNSWDQLRNQRVGAELLLWQPHVLGFPSHLFKHRDRPKDMCSAGHASPIWPWGIIGRGRQPRGRDGCHDRECQGWRRLNARCWLSPTALEVIVFKRPARLVWCTAMLLCSFSFNQ